MENITHINPYERMIPWTAFSSNKKRKKNLKKKWGKKSGKNFEALSRIVDDAHKNLFEKKAPFRLCVHKNNEDVLMDIVTLDKSNKIEQMFTRLITHDDMKTVVKRIHNKMGFILDYSV